MLTGSKKDVLLELIWNWWLDLGWGILPHFLPPWPSALANFPLNTPEVIQNILLLVTSSFLLAEFSSIYFRFQVCFLYLQDLLSLVIEVVIHEETQITELQLTWNDMCSIMPFKN